MKQVTVRMPLIGHERLARFRQRYDVSTRATFEAANIITLDDEIDPDRTHLAVGLWGVARTLSKSDLFTAGRRSEYPKLVVRVDLQLHALFVAACRRFGLSQNDAYAFVVLPWPDDTPAEILAYRDELTPRIVELARQLDADRRESQLAGLIPFR